MFEHPEITWAERTGYPSWMQEEETEDEEPEEDYERDFWGDEYEDRCYEERREAELFGD